MEFKRSMGGWHVQLTPTSSIRVSKNMLNELPWEYSVYDHDNGMATPITTVKGFKTNHLAIADATDNHSVESDSE